MCFALPYITGCYTRKYTSISAASVYEHIANILLSFHHVASRKKFATFWTKYRRMYIDNSDILFARVLHHMNWMASRNTLSVDDTLLLPQ